MPEAFVNSGEIEEEQSDERPNDGQENEPADPFRAAARGGGPDGPVAEHDLRALAEGCFPQPVPLGARAVGWIESEVDNWIRERIAESRGEASRAVHAQPSQRPFVR